MQVAQLMKENLTPEEADAVIELSILIDKDDEVKPLTLPLLFLYFFSSFYLFYHLFLFVGCSLLFLGHAVANLHQALVRSPYHIRGDHSTEVCW